MIHTGSLIDDIVEETNVLVTKTLPVLQSLVSIKSNSLGGGGVGSKRILPIIPSCYVYQCDKYGKVPSVFNIIPYNMVKPLSFNSSIGGGGGGNVDFINLTRILQLIDINLLMDNVNENKILREQLNELSKNINRLHVAFHTQSLRKNFDIASQDDQKAWQYIALMRLVDDHFFNNMTHLTYSPQVRDSSESKEVDITCGLFSFEFLMALFIQSTRYLWKANKYRESKEHTKAIPLYKEAIDIIEYMIGYVKANEQDVKSSSSSQNKLQKNGNDDNIDGSIDNEEEEEEDDTVFKKFHFIPSPNSLSSSSLLQPPKRNTIFSNHLMIKEQLVYIMEYFGGVIDDRDDTVPPQESNLSLLRELYKAQLYSVYYEYCMDKLGVHDNNEEWITTIKEIQQNSVNIPSYSTSYEELLQFSKSVLTYYDNVIKIMLQCSSTNYHFNHKTRLYYHVLFMREVWFYKHHLMIILYDCYQYEDELNIASAQHALKRLLNLINSYNEFQKHQLFDIDQSSPSKEMVSNIIEKSLLSKYHNLVKNIVSLYDHVNNIVLEIHMVGINEITLRTVDERFIKSTSGNNTQSKIRESLNLYKDSMTIYEKLTLLKKTYIHHNKTNHYHHSFPIEKIHNNTNGGGGGGGNIDHSKNQQGKLSTKTTTRTRITTKRSRGVKNAILHERNEWIKYLLSKVDENGQIVINIKDTDLIMNEINIVKDVMEFNHEQQQQQQQQQQQTSL